MGINIYKRRSLLPAVHLEEETTHEAPAIIAEKNTGINLDGQTLESLKACVSVCTLCTLHKTRTQTVFGVGNPQASLLVIGEGPGANEDLQGEPFVGRAGKLLDNMLLSIGLKREQIYIANIVKCRPPGNRDPLPEETASCTPYLQKQIELINPDVILAVGKIAAHYLLNSQSPLNRLRGNWHTYRNKPLLITYHPAYLLRSPKEKTKAYSDLLMLRQRLPR